jgi:hypothetical protein
MRPILKYGVPAAAGLATGGYALSQGEDPGSAALAGLAAVLRVEQLVCWALAVLLVNMRLQCTKVAFLQNKVLILDCSSR